MLPLPEGEGRGEGKGDARWVSRISTCPEVQSLPERPYGFETFILSCSGSTGGRLQHAWKRKRESRHGFRGSTPIERRPNQSVTIRGIRVSKHSRSFAFICGWNRRRRQAQCETGPAAFARLAHNVAAVRTRDLPRQRQAQPGPLDAAAQRIVGA